MKKKFWFLIPIILLAVIFSLLIFGQKSIFLKNKESIQQTGKQTNMKISSPAFQNNEIIPRRYTCDGENISPPLAFEEIPEGTQSLLLIVDDPDAPRGTFLHWLVFNISPQTKFIEENSLPNGARLGKNDFGRLTYGGPCPPYGVHRYYFKLFALDTTLNLPEGASFQEVWGVARDHILSENYLIGLYKRE